MAPLNIKMHFREHFQYEGHTACLLCLLTVIHPHTFVVGGATSSQECVGQQPDIF